MKLYSVAALVLAAFLTPALHAADAARFDLVGPKIDIRITRGGTTLPIAQVPSLQAGDKIWIKADLPSTQSNHLLIVVAFLRGTTNEPPDNWFTEIDTWDKKTIEGTTVVVPEGAEQALMFVAPQVGGDFKTLRSAVKGRPGLFIRADADLNEASFQQQRIERYLAAMKTVPQDDPKAIQERSAKLAATLALKPNADCFKQPVAQQVVCLTQSSAPILLDDGHGAGIAEALSNGPASDFINQASYTAPAGGGLYSAYVGAIVDAVHLISTLRTAQYQYIPGLSFPEGQTLNLKLNAPPSFHKPDSVIVIGLPAIQKAILPPLHPADPNQVACLLQPKMVLSLQGAPLVFATSFAHDLVLHLNRTGGVTELPLSADPAQGGLVVDKDKKREPLRPNEPLKATPTASKTPAKAGNPTDLTVTGTVRGYWGFDAFEGPTVTVQQVAGKDWKIVGNTQLLAGQDNKLTLTGQGTGCIQHIALSSDKAKDVDVSFKPDPDKSKKDTLALAVSLKTVEPGGYALAIQQFGDANRDKVPLTAYTAGITVGDLKIHAGDTTATLSGEGLKNVASVEIDKQTFTPAADSNDEILHLESKTGVSPAAGSEAVVKLKDGRTMNAKISASAARPSLKLVSMKSTPAEQSGALAVTLTNKSDIPLNGTVTFVVQTKDAFPRDEAIEVSTANNAVHTKLSVADNTLVLQDANTAVAHLDPLKAFGQSAFGRLAIRPVQADGTTGEWIGLGTLVRTPKITGIKCTDANAPTCALNGDNLFLAQSFAAGKDFAKPTDVPTGFAETTFNVPTPTDGTTLYLKLRDDPTNTATVTLPTPLQKSAQPAKPEPAAQATPAAASAPPTKPEPSPAPTAAASPAATPPATAAPATPQ
ncbi:hypothetical protein [Granulicella sp. L46]|uniref:hypothetical protein n=1 Tax=Granulicella sp. L46 TaxID=1641865 RepID=UPI00157602FD|nr:hypothetical protein [Granulicella sp. L46]